MNFIVPTKYQELKLLMNAAVARNAKRGDYQNALKRFSTVEANPLPTSSL
jgi:hypothetical protein